MIINGIIMSQSVVENLLRIGFDHLGEDSPFSKGTVVFSRMDRLWTAYILEENDGLINQIGDGIFEIQSRANEFATVFSRMDFLSIKTHSNSFNHLEAIRFFDSL